MNRNLRFLFFVNGLFNAVGAVILILFPTRIMNVFGIDLTPSQYFICYLLGACSFSLAVLSFYAQKITNGQSLRVIVLTFFLFHLATAIVGIYSYVQGLSPRVWGNVGIHAVFAILFWCFGRSKAITNGQ